MKVYFDSWLSKQGPLCVLFPVSMDLESAIGMLLYDFGAWNEPLIRQHFTPDEAEIILISIKLGVSGSLPL